MMVIKFNVEDHLVKKGDSEEDDEDWMREFMGGGDSVAGSPDDVRNDMASLSESATERQDAEDPFAKSEGRDRKRRKSKKTKKVEVEEVEDDVDDDDEFDEEDDDWDDDSGPKKKSERKKKTVRRRSVRRK